MGTLYPLDKDDVDWKEKERERVYLIFLWHSRFIRKLWAAQVYSVSVIWRSLPASQSDSHSRHTNRHTDLDSQKDSHTDRQTAIQADRRNFPPHFTIGYNSFLSDPASLRQILIIKQCCKSVSNFSRCPSHTVFSLRPPVPLLAPIHHMNLSYSSPPLQTNDILTEWKEDRIDGHVVDAEEGWSHNIRTNNDNLAKKKKK